MWEKTTERRLKDEFVVLEKTSPQYSSRERQTRSGGSGLRKIVARPLLISSREVPEYACPSTVAADRATRS